MPLPLPLLLIDRSYRLIPPPQLPPPKWNTFQHPCEFIEQVSTTLTLWINKQTNQIWLKLHVAVPLVSAYLISDKLQMKMIQSSASRVWLVFSSGLRLLMGLTWPRLAVLLQKNRRCMVVKTGVIYLKWPDSSKVLIFLYTVKYTERKKIKRCWKYIVFCTSLSL